MAVASGCRLSIAADTEDSGDGFRQRERLCAASVVEIVHIDREDHRSSESLAVYVLGFATDRIHIVVTDPLVAPEGVRRSIGHFGPQSLAHCRLK